MDMATHRFLFSLSILIGVLSIATAARPCKTILLLSTTSSYYPVGRQSQNSPFFLHRPRSLTFLFTEVREINPKQSFFIDKMEIVDVERKQAQTRVPPLQFHRSSVGNSFRERTMDIMNVVGALLFGAGCGALTAATMYLVWSLFSPRRLDFGDSDGDESEDDVSPKKMGYVAIPAANAKTKADANLPVAKEVI